MQTFIKKSAVLGALLLLGACATPEVVQTRQVGDDRLSCAELKQAIFEAEDFQRAARKEKGATGTNVAAYVFFWPALLVNYSNADEAEQAASDRVRNLTRIADAKRCPAF
jgi:hypothetical protein